MSLKIFLFLSVVICVACSSDDDMDDPIVDINSCLGNQSTPFFSQPCDTVNQFNSEDFCKITIIGDYSLSNEAKKYAELYCQNIGHSLLYESEAGETIEMIITNKSYRSSHTVSLTNIYCDGDTTRHIVYCHQIETIDIDLTSSDNLLQIRYSLSTMLDTRVDTDPGVGDVLSISRSTGLSFFTTDLYAVIFPGTLSYSTSFSQQHHESIELNGRIFNDVLTNDNNFINFDNYSFYVNPALGIVGFEDDKETLYTLID